MRIALVGNLIYLILYKKSIVEKVCGGEEGTREITWFDTSYSSHTKQVVKKIILCLLGIRYRIYSQEELFQNYDKIILADSRTYVILGRIINKLDRNKAIFSVPEYAVNSSLLDLCDIKSIRYMISNITEIKYEKETINYQCLQEMDNHNISLNKQILESFYASVIAPNSITELVIVDLDNERPNLAEVLRRNFQKENRKDALVIKEREELDKALNRCNSHTLFINLAEENDISLFDACLKNKNQYISLVNLLEALEFVSNNEFKFEQWLDENILCLAHYRNVYIYGETYSSLKLISVLKELNIEVTIISKDDLVYKAGKFELINQESKPEILIICDLLNLYEDTTRNYHVPIVRNGEEIYYFPVNRFFSKTRKTSAIDIAGNIVPFLKSAGVQVMVVKSPNDEECLLENRAVKRKMNICDMIPQAAWTRKTRVGLLKKFYGENYSEEFAEEILDLKKTRKYGFWMRADRKGKYINVIEGIRITEGNKRENKNKIIMFGPCWIQGIYVPDSQTISSYLQSYIKNYNVENRGDEYIDMNFALRNTIYHEGDIVIIIAENGSEEIYTESGILLESVASAYLKCNDLFNAIWDMPLHTNQLINKFVANELYKKIIRNNYLITGEAECHQEVSFNKEKVQLLKQRNWMHNKELALYLDEILRRTKDRIDSVDKVGAIVMNCNPFTNGHKYLIEKAHKMVDVLLVFVVEEDKSYFKFVDRIELVRKGTKEFDNVFVFPSGKFMISSMTMAAYFMKSSLQDTELNESDDIELFAGLIAPKLKIKVRFAGSEPIDKFTSNYNNMMSRILPEYGIEFIEIERMKGKSGDVISASFVRQCLESGNYKKIEEVVPYTTYEFLKERYIKQNEN